MTTWYFNGTDMATLGLSFVSGQKLAHGVSTMSLATSADFDAAPLMEYGQWIDISYSIDGGTAVVYFAGKVITPTRFGSGNEEGQVFEIADAWHELERTIYQESWGYGELVDEEDREHIRADRQVPKAIFGMNAGGSRISVGTQISNAIAYAADTGISIQAGSIPTGEIPTPSELQNVSIAEVISMALRYHPDWMPWIDHATSPPTFHVTAVASADPVEIATDGTGLVSDFEVIERSDLIPDAVRLVYEYAGEANIDGDPEIFRKAAIDKYPTEGPDEGAGVLVAVIPLQGMQMQVQKTRLHCRTIPTSQATAKEWLRTKYLHLHAIPLEDMDAEINVTGWEREMLTEPDDFPDPINPEAQRIDHDADVDKYPRELVRGQPEDWMRVRVGQMRITPTVEAAGGASPETLAAIAKGFPPVVITATNARNKIYHGPTQWVAPEDVPTGIAQSVYQAILAGVRYQGKVTLESEGMPTGQFLGKKLNLTGSAASELAAMNAPIHSVSWDIQSGSATIGFGPVPYLAPTDFLELQRILRVLPVTWWSTEERTGEKYGDDAKPSARGDTVTGFDAPQSIFEPTGGLDLQGAFYRIFTKPDGHTYLQGGTCTGGGGTDTAADIKIIDSGDGPTQAAGVHMYIVAEGDGVTADEVLLPGWDLSAASIGYNATVPDNTLPTASSPASKTCHVELGVFTASGFLPSALGDVEITHCLGGYHVTRTS